MILVDTHVHYYDCYPLCRFLDAACNNFRVAAKRLALPQPMGCLLMSGVKSQSTLEAIRRNAGSLSPNWRIEPTGESDSLLVVHDGQVVMTLLAGRQLVTREGLEVLALATDHDISEGCSLVDATHQIADAQALAVLPWGFGKWTFSRGTFLFDFLRSRLGSPAPRLYIGDTGGRARVCGVPRLLRWARRRGLPLLAGSDPLPLRHHAERAATYGVVLPGEMDLSRPAAWFRREMQALESQPEFFGGCSSLFNFLRDQIAIRVVRRR